MEKDKPVVYFTGKALFDETTFEGHTVARVLTLNHPVWGNDKVRTSSVVQQFEDGSFETLNTIYKPYAGEYIGN